MKLDMRYGVHPNDYKKYDTKELREKFLVEEIFEENNIKLTYTLDDRIIMGGIMPTTEEVILNRVEELGTDYFMQRREMGVINVGSSGSIEIDGKLYTLDEKDGLYIGMGKKELKFRSDNSQNPAKFYIVSALSDKEYETVKIDIKKANPTKLGSLAESNKRTIYKYIDPSVCQSSQLLMGMTILEEGSIWNTMPAHIHKRRTETYFYFDMEEKTRVFHFMGEKDETRHLVLKNNEGVISPSWSLHAGSGTGKYTFIWTMAGENQNYSDLNVIPMEELR